MIVAEELDARLADVDVPLSDARQDLGTAQSTGGSTSVRSLWDPGAPARRARPGPPGHRGRAASGTCRPPR